MYCGSFLDKIYLRLHENVLESSLKILYERIWAFLTRGTSHLKSKFLVYKVLPFFSDTLWKSVYFRFSTLTWHCLLHIFQDRIQLRDFGAFAWIKIHTLQQYLMKFLCDKLPFMRLQSTKQNLWKKCMNICNAHKNYPWE